MLLCLLLLVQEIRSLAKQLFLSYHCLKRNTDVKVRRGKVWVVQKLRLRLGLSHTSDAAAVVAAVQIQMHLSSFVEGSPCRVACEDLFAGASWRVSPPVLLPLLLVCR